MTRILAFPILLAAALALSGCGSSVPKGFICPAAAALVDAGSLTVMSPGSSQPLYRVDIAKVGTACDYDADSNQIVARIAVNFVASRPAGGGSAQYAVPYFVGLSQSGTTIVDKKLYSAQFAFAPGQLTTSFNDRIGSYVIVPAADKKSTDYEMLIGLQLTRDQLDYNRRAGRYPQ
jgi:hypothetical protein